MANKKLKIDKVDVKAGPVDLVSQTESQAQVWAVFVDVDGEDSPPLFEVHRTIETIETTHTVGPGLHWFVADSIDVRVKPHIAIQGREIKAVCVPMGNVSLVSGGQVK